MQAQDSATSLWDGWFPRRGARREIEAFGKVDARSIRLACIVEQPPANGEKKTRHKKRDTLFGLLKVCTWIPVLKTVFSSSSSHDLLVSPGRHSFNALVIK